MTSYVHLRRYGKKPGSPEVATIDVIGDGQVVYRGLRIDLRTGDKGVKHPGFGHHLDGRYFEWNRAENTLLLHHPDSRVVSIDIVSGGPLRLVGAFAVCSDDARKPWLIIDANRGTPLGRVEGMRGDATHGTALYSPNWFDPRNDRTLWLCEFSRLCELDVKERRMARTIDAPDGYAFDGVAALADGHVITIQRTIEDKAAFKREAGRVALYSPSGERLRDVPGNVMFLSVLGDRFIVSDDHKEHFVIYDRTLEPIGTVSMYEPGKDGFNRIVPMPSGREWIGVGGRGEWDHYGEPELAPVATPKAKQPAKKPAAKKTKE